MYARYVAFRRQLRKIWTKWVLCEEEWNSETIADLLSKPICPYCGGLHVGGETIALACPRVKRLIMGAEKPTEVEFWKWNEWPRDKIIFLEELPTEFEGSLPLKES